MTNNNNNDILNKDHKPNDTDKDNDNNNLNNKDECTKLYLACCEYYKHVEEISNQTEITFEQVEEIFETLLCENMIMMYQDIDEIIEGIKFYKEIFEKQKLITHYNELIDLVKFQFVDNRSSPHLESKYNLVGFCMKITTHLMWKICYDVSPRVHTNPNDAITDILYPLKASHREMKKIFAILEKEYGVELFKK